jgi:radical SAM protein with 4Fe4S-binding SPASM domain
MAHIAPAGVCDLSCELCPTSNPETIAKTLLPFETFRKLIDGIGDYLIYLILWSWGEPLLNPEIYRMVSYARDRDILSVTSSNLNRFSRDEARAMIDSGLEALIIALDGATPETYARLRKGGDFHRVVDHTRLLMEEKAAAGARAPIVNLRMVVSRENEGEMEEFRRLARELKVDMVSFKAFSTRQPGYSDPEHDRRFAPQCRRYRWYRYHPDYSADRKAKPYRCKFPWTKPTLFADGTVLACEFDLKGTCAFGNIERQSFEEIWFSPRAEAFRKAFLRDRDSVAFCRDCVYDFKLIDGCVLEWEDLRHERIR